MAKNLSSRPSKEATVESLLGTHHGYTITLRSVDNGYRNAGQQYVIEGPKNEVLIALLKKAGARWDGYDKVWTIAKSSGSKLLKIVEQLPEILAGQVKITDANIDAAKELLRPINNRWHNRIAVEMAGYDGLRIHADVGQRTAEYFLEIGCKQGRSEEILGKKYSTFWLPITKHQALRDLIERLPNIWAEWAEVTRQQVEAVVGTYGAYSVRHGALGLYVKGPYTEDFKAAMNGLKGLWYRDAQQWRIDTANAARLRAVMVQIQQRQAEDMECKAAAAKAAAAQQEAARKAAVAEQEAEDQRVGRITVTERNVEKGFLMEREYWSEGKLYLFEKVVYAGEEYEYGDWMVSATYVRASDEVQEQREEEIRQRRQLRVAVELATSEMKDIAMQIAQWPIPDWPNVAKEVLFDNHGKAPFYSIYLVTPCRERAVISFDFSDYSNYSTGTITEVQIERIKELAAIIARGRGIFARH